MSFLTCILYFGLSRGDFIESSLLAGSVVLRYALGRPADDALQFAAVIDAGSSGSRAYLYTWQDPGNSHDPLLKIHPMLDENNEPLVKSVSPGLSR